MSKQREIHEEFYNAYDENFNENRIIAKMVGKTMQLERHLPTYITGKKAVMLNIGLYTKQFKTLFNEKKISKYFEQHYIQNDSDYEFSTPDIVVANHYFEHKSIEDMKKFIDWIKLRRTSYMVMSLTNNNALDKYDKVFDCNCDNEAINTDIKRIINIFSQNFNIIEDPEFVGIARVITWKTN